MIAKKKVNLYICYSFLYENENIKVPYKILLPFVAGMAELVDALDLKSSGRFLPCRFKSGSRYSCAIRSFNLGFLAQLVRVSA